MPRLSPDSVPILNGKVVLYKWKKSPFWQARFRIGSKWIRKTTKTSDLSDASDLATDFYMEARFKEKHDLPVTTRRFKSVALEAQKKLRETIDAGQGKSVYRDYIQAIDNYLIPFFGNHNVHTIDYPLIREFNKWRQDKFGRVPSKSTINTHTAALNQVFDMAVVLKHMGKIQVPDLKIEKGDGKATERRPTFNLTEYRQLIIASRAFMKDKAQRGRSRMMRELLHDYILFVANTGVRPGTETDNLRWNHIRIDEEGDLEIYVKGKTRKGREIVPRTSIKYPINRLAKRPHDLRDLTFEEVLKTDKKVFRLEDGTVTKNLRQTFKALLINANLLKDPRTQQNRALYSLRHFYATQCRIHERVPVDFLAIHMGTSVKMIEKHYGHIETRHKKAGFKK